ncbi:MAG: sodium-dependent transporter [Lentisphaeria bacterium]|nr:sodium-dependent transporter [Lentisphaeria bacterium]
MSNERETLGSRLGFLLLTAGCAIGLGNIWRFPFITGKYGGALFVVFYVLFLLLMGLPMLVIELSVGRGSQRTLFGAARLLPANKKFPWTIPAGIFFSGNVFLMIFYTTVTGWMIAYAFDYLTGSLAGLTGTAVAGYFNSLIGDPWRSGGFMLFTVVTASLICAAGLKQGVERVVKYLMGGLFVLLLVLCINSLMLPGAKEGMSFYLLPDIKNMGQIDWTGLIAAAMGQAFFTLSVGIGSVAIFGSYIKKEHTLTAEALPIIGMDTMVAFLSGVIIFPACTTYNVDVSAGPGLVFISLPEVFNRMNGGRVWGGLFFLFMSAAAYTTVIAVFENLIALMMDEWKFSRRKASWVNCVVIALLSLPCVLGFNLWKHIQPLGKGSTILDFEDYIVSDNLLPLGGLFFILFCGLPAAWGIRNFFAEANAGKGVKLPEWSKYYLFGILPLLIIFLFVIGFANRWF